MIRVGLVGFGLAGSVIDAADPRGDLAIQLWSLILKG